MILLVVRGHLVRVPGGGELLRLEPVRVGDGRPDRLGGPVGVADRLLDVCLGDVGVHGAWRQGRIGVQGRWTDAWRRLPRGHDDVGAMVPSQNLARPEDDTERQDPDRDPNGGSVSFMGTSTLLGPG